MEHKEEEEKIKMGTDYSFPITLKVELVVTLTCLWQQKLRQLTKIEIQL